jgi:hypothetical protein
MTVRKEDKSTHAYSQTSTRTEFPIAYRVRSLLDLSTPRSTSPIVLIANTRKFLFLAGH